MIINVYWLLKCSCALDFANSFETPSIYFIVLTGHALKSRCLSFNLLLLLFCLLHRQQILMKLWHELWTLVKMRFLYIWISCLGISNFIFLACKTKISSDVSSRMMMRKVRWKDEEQKQIKRNWSVLKSNPELRKSKVSMCIYVYTYVMLALIWLSHKPFYL